MATNYMYKPIKSATKSRKRYVTHKNWVITDETALTYGVQEFFGQYSNGSFSIGDINDSNIAREGITNGVYNRTLFNSINHLYYRDPESHYFSGDPQYFKQQERKLHREVHVLSIPSGIFGDRIKENSVTMSNANTTIYDDGEGNLRDNGITNYPNFVTQSRGDYFIKIGFDDGWKFQKGNYVSDRTFINGNIDLLDISDGPYEPEACNVTFDYNLNGAFGVSGSSYIETTGTASIVEARHFETIEGLPELNPSTSPPKASSFIRIKNSQQLNNLHQAYDKDFCVALRVKLPLSQSVTSSFTGPYENPAGSGYRTTKVHDYNTLVTSRQWSTKVPWELNVYNHNTALNGKIFFTRGTTGNFVSITSSNALSDNDWHNVVLQKSGSLMQLYVDGTLQASKTDPIDGVHVAITTDIHIGARPWGKQYRRKVDLPRTPQGPNVPELPPQQYVHERANNYIYPAAASFDEFKLMKKALTSAEVTSFHNFNGRDNNIIGNVFYNHGMLTFTSLSSSYDQLLTDYTLNFEGSLPVDVHNYKCVVENGDFNVSLNPTLRKNYDMNQTRLKGIASASFFNPYITTIGLYNDSNELLAIGKLAYPIKSPEELDIVFNVQFDT